MNVAIYTVILDSGFEVQVTYNRRYNDIEVIGGDRALHLYSLEEAKHIRDALSLAIRDYEEANKPSRPCGLCGGKGTILEEDHHDMLTGPGMCRVRA